MGKYKYPRDQAEEAVELVLHKVETLGRVGLHAQ